MQVALIVVSIVTVVVLVSALSERVGVSAPLVLTLLGLIVGFLPGVPIVELNREIVMVGLLPPLLYAAAVNTSVIDLRENARGIGLLSVGLVIFTAVGTGLVLWKLLGVPLPLAIAFGGVVAPPDAVAATAVAKGIGLPERLVTLIEGESLFNDATALVILRMGIIAMGTTVTAVDVGLQFAWAAVGGVGFGMLAAWLIHRVRTTRLFSVNDTALSFLAPWIAYIPAEELGASGVLAVVVMGVLVGHHAYTDQSAESRMSQRSNWTTIQFLLENGVFLLIGLQARGIVEGAASQGASTIVLASVVTVAVVMLLRPIWVFATLPLWSPGVPFKESWKSAAVGAGRACAAS